MIRTYITIKTDFEGVHQWSNCDIKEVDFLKHPHYHKFLIEVCVEVEHSNRAVEFIVLKHDVDDAICVALPSISEQGVYQLENKSCEMIAKDILDKLSILYKVKSVTVSEDGNFEAAVVMED